jgi:hypothetical protein
MCWCCPSWQVAETFAFGVDASGKAVAPGGADPDADPAAPATTPLSELARLDTCVTVVDASNLLDNLHSLQTLKVRARMCGVCVHGVREARTRLVAGFVATASTSPINCLAGPQDASVEILASPPAACPQHQLATRQQIWSQQAS